MSEERAPTPVEEPAAQPSSTEAEEREAGVFDSWIRGGLRAIGFGRAPEADAETPPTDEATEEATEPDWTPPKSKAEYDEQVRRDAQSMKDKELARIAREQQAGRTQAEWTRIKTLAENGDTWALGEIAQEQVRQQAEQEQKDAAYGQFLTTHVPLFDQTYLDPLLSSLPKDAWAPIVGDGLTTLEERAQAVPKIIAAHREKAVADALTDEPFVKRLLASPSFRAAWQKSPVVREQYEVFRRGGDTYDEPDAPAGVGRGAQPVNEDQVMDDIIRGQHHRLALGRPDRLRQRGNRDLIE